MQQYPSLFQSTTHNWVSQNCNIEASDRDLYTHIMTQKWAPGQKTGIALIPCQDSRCYTFFVLSDEVDEIEVYGSEAQSGTQLATYSFEVKSLIVLANVSVHVYVAR